MRLTAEKNGPSGSVYPASLDWESLGRLVRQRTLEAVTTHFAVRAATQSAARCENTPDRDVTLE